MTSKPRRSLRATAAVTGMVALGAGFTGTAQAEEAHTQQGAGLHTASVDGFSTESIVPTDALLKDTDALLNDMAETITELKGSQAARAASPTDSLAERGQLQGFQFEMPPTEFSSAMNTTGEEQLAGTGLEPTTTAMTRYVVPAVTGGQRIRAAGPEQQFGSENGFSQTVDGPADNGAGPVTGSVMPAIAMITGTVIDATSNNDSTSNHKVVI